MAIDPFSFSSNLQYNEPFPFWLSTPFLVMMLAVSFKSWKYLETPLFLKDGVLKRKRFSVAWLLINQACIWIIWCVLYILFIFHNPMFISLEVHDFLVKTLMVLVIIFSSVHQLMRAGIK